MTMLRDKLKHDIIHLRASLTAYQRMIDFYLTLKEKEKDDERWAYLDERITHLYGTMAEHEIAVMNALDESKIQGD